MVEARIGHLRLEPARLTLWSAELQAAGITEGGDGPTLTIEAGATLAWETNADFMIVNRGSQIFAVGEPDAPITLTSVSDVNGTVGPEDVQQWGGMVINGFGVTNACSYTGTRGVDLALDGECHVDSEGSAGNDENQYGGDNDADDSGVYPEVRQAEARYMPYHLKTTLQGTGFWGAVRVIPSRYV